MHTDINDAATRQDRRRSFDEFNIDFDYLMDSHNFIPNDFTDNRAMAEDDQFPERDILVSSIHPASIDEFAPSEFDGSSADTARNSSSLFPSSFGDLSVDGERFNIDRGAYEEFSLDDQFENAADIMDE